MGLLDNISNSIKESQEKSAALAQKRNECAKDLTANINITFGNNELGISPRSALRQRANGDVYFNIEDNILYRFVSYEWQGPIYEQMITSNKTENIESQTVKKGKSGRMATGAIVGTLLFPGVGTVVGAAIGAGGKGKSKTIGSSNSDMQQISKQVEKDGKAIIKLQKIGDNSIHAITIVCNSDIDTQIRCFNFEQIKTTAALSKDATDSLKGVKALKELLDMGAITQEEFDIKKKHLLNL